jgi:hypothetical protein
MMVRSPALRIYISLLIAIASGVLCWLTLKHFHLGGGDFTWSYLSGNDLLQGLDPYRRPVSRKWIPYPLPAALIGILFTPFRIDVAAAIFFGLSSGVLSFGLCQNGYIRLLAFLACPYFAALMWAQWTPLIAASAFFPPLMALLLVKPHIAAPVVLTRMNRTGMIVCVIFGLLSLLLYPTWPLKWISQLAQFQRYFPLLTLPGPLLLLAIRRFHDRDARLLLLASVFPQRWYYDAFILWIIPKSRKELLWTSLASWAAFAWRLREPQQTTEEMGTLCVLCFYLPMLFVILMRPRSNISAEVPNGVSTLWTRLWRKEITVIE